MYEEIFETIKDKFAGVKFLSSTEIVLLTIDGQEFIVNQGLFDKEYDIRFFCNHDDCAVCEDQSDEKWEVVKK